MEIRLQHDGSLVDEAGFRAYVRAQGLAQDPPMDIGLPEHLTPEMIASFGGDPVLASPPPTVVQYQTAMRNGVVQDQLGNWVQAWLPVDWTPEQIAADKASAIASKWEAIKAERDGPRVAGGVQVGAYWFHTDTDSRIRWLGFKDSGRDMLAAGGQLTDQVIIDGDPVFWKSLSGVFVPVTVQLAFDVVTATKVLDKRLFVQAETHRAMMAASPYPHLYDITTGWPVKWPPGE